LWLRRKFAGRGVPNFTSFLVILTVEVVGDLHYFNGFPDDMKMMHGCLLRLLFCKI
jgi:hypothetical protein